MSVRVTLTREEALLVARLLRRVEPEDQSLAASVVRKMLAGLR